MERSTTGKTRSNGLLRQRLRRALVVASLTAGLGAVFAPPTIQAYPPDATVEPDEGSTVLPSSGDEPTDDTTPLPSATLPETGGSTDVALVLALGGGLVAVGGLTTVAARRRTTDAPTA